jgi:hypothetical protein
MAPRGSCVASRVPATGWIALDLRLIGEGGRIDGLVWFVRKLPCHVRAIETLTRRRQPNAVKFVGRLGL